MIGLFMKIIAYYLPQFHPIVENNRWWGEGFTEWTNVGRAKKYFKNHDQPKVPADLGYYDLRVPSIRSQQAALAKESGVDAFCYWHYWFGNGKRLLELPFSEVLKSGQPDFPFCLGWANESWKAKVWDATRPNDDRVLIEQSYPGLNDINNHFYALLDAFRDARYLRVQGKPVFVIYKPFLLQDASQFIELWNKLAAKENVADGFHFIGHTECSSDVSRILQMGFSAVNVVRNGEHRFNKSLIARILIPALAYKWFNKPLVINYSTIIDYFVQDIDRHVNVYPSIIPNWDHTPRSGVKGVVYHNSTPGLFERHLRDVFRVVKGKPEDDQIVFLKSWNEWGEGNYMEPDLKYGKEYIYSLAKVRKEFDAS